MNEEDVIYYKIYNTVKQVISDICECSLDELSFRTRLVYHLGIDILDFVEISLAIEDHFGIILTENDENCVSTIRDLVDVIELKIKQKGNI